MRDHSFQLANFGLELFEFGGVAKWCPEARGGFFVATGVGAASLEARGQIGELQRGVLASVQTGYGVWILPQWSLEALFRIAAARVFGDALGATTVIVPGVQAGVVFH